MPETIDTNEVRKQIRKAVVKQLVIRIAVGTAVIVVSELAANAILKKIESKPEETTSED